jgi:hypothetical protein
MNRRAVILCLTGMLLLVSGVIAGDAPLPEGSSARNTEAPGKKARLQEYRNDIPQQGNYYEWDGSKWQRYKAGIPQHGSYLKQVKPEEKSSETRQEK